MHGNTKLKKFEDAFSKQNTEVAHSNNEGNEIDYLQGHDSLILLSSQNLVHHSQQTPPAVLSDQTPCHQIICRKAVTHRSVPLFILVTFHS